MLIHAEALRDRAVFTHLVNHAVGIFVVLFGLNSELWWRGRELRSDLGRWYASRARRLLVPMWAALPVWWALALSFRPEGIRLSARLAVAHAGGYLAHVGTGCSSPRSSSSCSSSRCCSRSGAASGEDPCSRPVSRARSVPWR